MQALTKTVNKLVNSLGKANSPARTGGRQKRRQRGAKAKQNSDRAFGQTGPVAINRSAISTTAVRLPAAEGRVVRMRTGISDMSDITFSYQAGVMVASGTSTGVGAVGTVFFVNAAGSTAATSFVPVQPANGTWGQSYIADVWKHFARKRYKRIMLTIVPSGAGAQSTTPCSFNFAPYRSGNATVSSASTTGGAATPLATASIMGMKDNVEFPCYQTMEMDITKYIAGGSGSRQDEFDERGEVDEQGATTPCMLAFSGQYAGIPVATGNLVLANVFVSVIVDLLDFSGGFTASTPELRRSAVGYDGRVYLRSKVSDDMLERCLRKMEMDDLKVSSRYHCEDTDVKTGASRLATGSTPHISADGIRDGYIRVETDRDAKESYSKSVGRKETTPKRK